MTNTSKKNKLKTLHINNENNLQNMEKNQYKCTVGKNKTKQKKNEIVLKDFQCENQILYKIAMPEKIFLIAFSLTGFDK